MAEPQVALVDPQIDDAQNPPEELPPPIPTGLELTTLDPHFRGSPYATLADMRERAPVHRDDELRRVYVSRHADVDALLHDDELFTDPRKSNKKTLSRKRSDSESRRSLPLELMDGPEHARLRRFVGTVFSDAVIRAFEPRIDAIIRAILDELEESEFEFEVMGLYADRVAGTVMLEMLGIEPTDYRLWRRRCDASRAAAFNPFRTKDEAIAGAAANVELDSALRAEVDKRRAKPGPDLVSAMLKLDIDGDTPTHGEIIHIARMLLIGGVSNTADLISNGVRAMLQNTRQMTKLREHPELAAAAVEELLRFDTPIADTIRIANRDMTVDECPIKRGETVTVSIAGANRDDALFAKPDRFDIERRDIRHLSFGAGRHACLGATFARVVAAKAILGLIVQFPESELSPRGWAFSSVPGLRVMTHFWIKT
jgi:cytochrome P450